MISISKNTAILLYCCFRQAERSVHYAHSCPDEWSRFTAYYRGDRRGFIAGAIGMLKGVGPTRGEATIRPNPSQLSPPNFARSMTGIIFNRFKNNWSFSLAELSYFHSILEDLLSVVDGDASPTGEELIRLRMACFECHHAIARKLIGVRELRRADRIEHFQASKYIEHVRLRDLDIREPGEEGWRF